MLRRVVPAALVAALLAAPSNSAVEVGAGVDEVQECVRRNLPERTARQSVVLERRDRAGDTRRLDATIFWKRGEDGRSRVLLQVDGPPDERGTAFLLLEREGRNDMFTYLPELEKVRRITSRAISGTFLGTDFSYEDLEELQSVSDRASVERLPDAQVDGRPVYVLSGAPAADSGSSYQRVVSYVDRESCVALRTLLYRSGEQAHKELVVEWKDVERRGERWVARKATLRNLQDGSETRVVIEKLEFDLALPDGLFSQSELARGH